LNLISRFSGIIRNCLVITAFCGCSIHGAVLNQVGDSLSRTGDIYDSDDDLELVAAAAPFGLKLIEGMLSESPRHEGLLLAATRGFAQYAYAFVESPAQELEDQDVARAYADHLRAKKLFLRARDFGLRGLEQRHPGFRESLFKNRESLLAETYKKDVPFLYWTAVSWAEAISLDLDNANLLAEFPIMKKLADRAMELDESYNNGAIHLFFINLSMIQSLPEKVRLTQARSHFDRAVALSSGQQAAPYVTYAEAVSIPTRNRDEFVVMLDKALQIDVTDPSPLRMANTLYQRRARWLHNHIDHFFAD
jgi:predicted anti-sigma-YlaC factor YlaD